MEVSDARNMTRGALCFLEKPQATNGLNHPSVRNQMSIWSD